MDDKFVSDNDTASIVNTSHLHGFPVYLFVNPLKLTHGTSDDQKVNLKENSRSHDGIEYAHVSHSHDIVDLNLVDHVITERGEIDKAEIHGYRVSKGGA